MTTLLTLISVQIYWFCFNTTLMVAFRSVQSHACSVCFSINSVFTDTILCNFAAVFHVVCRCFIIGRLSVHFWNLTADSLSFEMTCEWFAWWRSYLNVFVFNFSRIQISTNPRRPFCLSVTVKWELARDHAYEFSGYAERKALHKPDVCEAKNA